MLLEMPYYKPAIGKTPFFTNNAPFHVKHDDCRELKKQLEAYNILAVVQAVPNGCSVISSFPCKECIDTLSKH